MEIQLLYDTAKDYVEKVKEEKPAYASEKGLTLCLIMSDTREMYSGLTSIGIRNEEFVTIPAECVALTAMLADGHTKAKEMIIISFEDCSIVEPCDACLDLLLHLHEENDCCEVAVSFDSVAAVKDLKPDTSDSPFDFFSGFGEEEQSDNSAMFTNGFDESYSAPQHEPVKAEKKELGEERESLGAPAEFASAVSIDKNNPFYEPTPDADGETSESSEKSEVKFLNKMEEETKEEAADASKGGNDTLSKEELLKQAKKRKKVAKANFNFFKKKM